MLTQHILKVSSGRWCWRMNIWHDLLINTMPIHHHFSCEGRKFFCAKIMAGRPGMTKYVQENIEAMLSHQNSTKSSFNGHSSNGKPTYRLTSEEAYAVNRDSFFFYFFPSFFIFYFWPKKRSIKEIESLKILLCLLLSFVFALLVQVEIFHVFPPCCVFRLTVNWEPVRWPRQSQFWLQWIAKILPTLLTQIRSLIHTPATQKEMSF